MNLQLLSLTLVASLTSLANASLQIVRRPMLGGSWTASDGTHMQAHGPGVTKVGNTYYIIGENKINGSSFQSINCYSSTNLVEWAYVGELLTLQSSGDLGPNRVVERPKVIYNDAMEQYVMYMHIDNPNYGEARVGVATGSSVCGKFTYRGSWRPLGFESRDMGLFKDDDGTAYLMTEDRSNGLRIDRLSSDYLNVTSNVHTWSEKYESPAILKRNGVYFMFGSHLTSWNTNDNIYSTATSLSGPWSAWKNFAPVGSNTFNSQTSFILPVSHSFAMFMGDRWTPSNLMASTYIWLPLKISGTTASLTWYDNWIPSVDKGTWFKAPSDTTYEAEAGTLSGGAQKLSCSGCSGGTSVGYLGGPTGGALVINNIVSDITGLTTVRIRYANGDSTQRFADVTVNRVKHRVAFVPSGGGQTVFTASFTATLMKGNMNTMKIEGVNGGWGE
ncbi:galactan 1,3-beta-galactosidase [Pyronema omphalodes]|nr:galactan 1,3-beta-galactosidase [Pyronema omphalodes]